jgi:hypothetical protein
MDRNGELKQFILNCCQNLLPFVETDQTISCATMNNVDHSICITILSLTCILAFAIATTFTVSATSAIWFQCALIPGSTVSSSMLAF